MFLPVVIRDETGGPRTMSFSLQAEDNGRKKNKRRKNIKDQNQRVYLQLVILSHITDLAPMI